MANTAAVEGQNIATVIARLMVKAVADDWRFEKRLRKLDKLEAAMERLIHEAAGHSNVYPIRGGQRPHAIDDARKATMSAAEILLAVVRAEGDKLRPPGIFGRDAVRAAWDKARDKARDDNDRS
jgi:hypothetical protein